MSGAPRIWLFAALIGAVTTLPASSPAQDRNSDCKRSQDCALGAFKGGEIRALSEVLAILTKVDIKIWH
jgi:hypothetical protein